MNNKVDHSFFKIAAKYVRDWWHLPLTIALVVLFFTIGQFPFTTYAGWKVKQAFPDSWQKEFAKLGDPGQWGEMGLDPNLSLGLYLLAFAGATFGLYLATRIIQNRPFKTLITPHRGINWSKIGFGFMLWAGITVIAHGIAYVLAPEDYVFNFELKPFLMLILLVLFILPIQTSFEELFVRGYLMQWAGVYLKYPIWAIIITSIFFASLHMMNPEIEKYGRVMMLTYYISAAVFLAIMTVMDDSLELALGVHLATNLTSALFVTYEGAAIQTPAMLKMINTEMDVNTLGFYIMAAIFLFICWKKYNWRKINYLFIKIELNEHDYVEQINGDRISDL